MSSKSKHSPNSIERSAFAVFGAGVDATVRAKAADPVVFFSQWLNSALGGAGGGGGCAASADGAGKRRRGE